MTRPGTVKQKKKKKKDLKKKEQQEYFFEQRRDRKKKKVKEKKFPYQQNHKSGRKAVLKLFPPLSISFSKNFRIHKGRIRKFH